MIILQIENIQVELDNEEMVGVKYTASSVIEEVEVSTEVVMAFEPQTPVEGDALIELIESNEEHDRARYILYSKFLSIKSKPVAPTLDEVKAVGVEQIDTVIARIIESRTKFQMGYEKREAAALAYKNADYKGDPTIWITAFADEAGLPYQTATNVILSQAVALRAALEQLEALRMRKYRVQRATTVAEAEAARAVVINEALTIEATLP